MTSTIEKYEVRNHRTNAVQFTAEISITPDMLSSVKLGLAVKWGRDNDADLVGANLSGADLSNADLSNADLGGAYLNGANLRYANLRNADLSYADLSNANLGVAYLSSADLSDANLSGANLSSAYLLGANLRYAYLLGVDLRGAYLSSADLRDAYLSSANLSSADLSGGDLPPVKIENIHQAVYEAASKDGALEMESRHCGTAHCRAGWVVTLAGEGGKALEWAMGTPAAAALIYLVSDPRLERIPDFYASNADALADMKALAEKEAQP